MSIAVPVGGTYAEKGMIDVGYIPLDANCDGETVKDVGQTPFVGNIGGTGGKCVACSEIQKMDFHIKVDF